MPQETSRYRHPDAIVGTDWLEAHLDDTDLRVFDCTTYLRPPEEGSGVPYVIESGRADYEAGHIPGSGFLDLQGELSDQSSPLRFMLPPAERFAEVMGGHGVGVATRVVLYGRGGAMWATRLWWMLRAFGFDDAAVLDGGWEKWLEEGRPVSADGAAYPEATFTPRPRAGLFVGKDAVLAAIGDRGTCTVNALLPELHRGESDRYGRPGRVPGSVNVPYAALIDAETRQFVGAAAAKARFEAAGATPDRKIITYCGGGIAATLDAFILHRLGYTDVAVYDASMSEWAKDESLPIETD